MKKNNSTLNTHISHTKPFFSNCLIEYIQIFIVTHTYIDTRTSISFNVSLQFNTFFFANYS